MDSKGQITIDYLIGITIFLLTIVFVFNYVSGIFTPFQSNSDEVTLVADRVSTSIVESRLSAGDESVPNLVCSLRTQDFFAELDDKDINYDMMTSSLGMKGSYLSYELNVTLQNSTHIVQAAGKDIPAGVNVGQTRRIVLYRDESTGSTEMMIMSFRVW